jgi:GH15 family glucan-1,4-alpha-glucosidase
MNCFKNNSVIGFIFWFSVLIPSSSGAIDWEIFGPTRVNATVGNGSLSCGISRWGEITVLRYPYTSHWDQLDYKTKEGEKSRDEKYFGALENQGAFFLLKIGNNIFSLRDLDLENINQRYKDDDSAILITEYKIQQGTIKVYDFVHPNLDIFVRKVELDLQTNEDVYIIHYQNLAPTTIKVPKYPLQDWQDDTLNDFGSFEKNRAVFHFTPSFLSREEQFQEYKKIKGKNYDEILNYAAQITYGIFIGIKVVGGYELSAYTGFDGRCGGDRDLPDFLLESSFEKIKKADLSYKEKTFALCSADSFVASKVCQNGKCESPVFVIISAGRNLSDIEKNLSLSQKDILALETETENYWKNIVKRMKETRWYSKLTYPEARLCSRALISLFQVIDRETKAAVASLSTQPPYAEDWPRDGAYFNLFLDLVGFHDIARERNLFYVKVQRKEPEGGIPAGTWAMDFYADGMVGGPWDFEIDQVGFVLWSWINHIKFEKGEAKREYMKKIYEPIKLSAYEVLIGCKDQNNNLHCKTHEDDDINPTQTMAGAGPLYAAMRMVIDFAGLYGDYKLMEDMKKRFSEYHEAILKNFSQDGFFNFPATIINDPNDPRTKGMSYVLFPAGFRFSNPEQIKHYAERVIAVLNYNFSPERGYIIYEGKWILSLIYAAELLKHFSYSDYQRLREQAEKFLKILVEEVPTDGTYHMGEVAVYKNGRYENRIAMPHVWEATLTCMTAIALREPDILKDMGMEIYTEGQEKISGGCSCNSYDVGLSLLLVLLYYYIIFLIARLQRKGVE